MTKTVIMPVAAATTLPVGLRGFSTRTRCSLFQDMQKAVGLQTTTTTECRRERSGRAKAGDGTTCVRARALRASSTAHGWPSRAPAARSADFGTRRGSRNIVSDTPAEFRIQTGASVAGEHGQ